MLQEIFEDIISLMPSNLKNNKLFTEITKSFSNEIPNDNHFNQFYLKVPENDFFELISTYPELHGNLEIGEDEGRLLHLTLYINQGLVTISIKNINEIGRLKIAWREINGKQKEIELIVSNKHTFLRKLSKTEELNWITDYSYDINVYDKDGKPISIDLEDDKDIEFSKEFCIPEEEARKYRLHFKEYIDFLNESRLKGINKEVYSNINDSMFCPPFKLEDMEVFLKEELDKMAGEEPEEYKSSGKLNNIIKSLKEIIGPSEEIILSEDLYDAFSNYLLGILDKILANDGLIIKKIRGQYILYYIHIENDKIMGIHEILNDNSIEKIIEANQTNQHLESLNDFFGRGYILK